MATAAIKKPDRPQKRTRTRSLSPVKDQKEDSLVVDTLTNTNPEAIIRAFMHIKKDDFTRVIRGFDVTTLKELRKFIKPVDAVTREAIESNRLQILSLECQLKALQLEWLEFLPKPHCDLVSAWAKSIKVASHSSDVSEYESDHNDDDEQSMGTQCEWSFTCDHNTVHIQVIRAAFLSVSDSRKIRPDKSTTVVTYHCASASERNRVSKLDKANRLQLMADHIRWPPEMRSVLVTLITLVNIFLTDTADTSHCDPVDYYAWLHNPCYMMEPGGGMIWESLGKRWMKDRMNSRVRFLPPLLHLNRKQVIPTAGNAEVAAGSTAHTAVTTTTAAVTPATATAAASSSSSSSIAAVT